MRRLTVPASATCVALIVAACGGGSAEHVSGHTSAGGIAAGTTTVLTRPAVQPVPPSAAQIERAATLTAAQPGFTARLSARISLPQLGGDAVTAVGSGAFDPRSSSGTLDVAIGLPGLLSLAGPLPTQLRLVGNEAYVKVTPDVAGQLGISPGWRQDGIRALGLGDSLSPREILREVARDVTRTVHGQRAHVTIDPATGLVHTIVLTYAVTGGYRVHVHLTLTGFSAQAATTPPARSADLRSALTSLGF